MTQVIEVIVYTETLSQIGEGGRGGQGGVPLKV